MSFFCYNYYGDNMIIEYDNKYDEDIKDLLVSLQSYIASIDKYKYNILTDEYREKAFKETIDEMNKYEGKMYLYVENDKALGLIIGIINNEEINTYDFKAPKRGRITEFIVDSSIRGKGIGTLLLNEIENHLKNVGCKDILLNVFGYNDSAIKFYKNNKYEDRLIEMIKKIN